MSLQIYIGYAAPFYQEYPEPPNPCIRYIVALLDGEFGTYLIDFFFRADGSRDMTKVRRVTEITKSSIEECLTAGTIVPLDQAAALKPLEYSQEWIEAMICQDHTITGDLS